MPHVWWDGQAEEPYQKEKVMVWTRPAVEESIDTYIIEMNVGPNAKRNRDIIKDRLIDGVTCQQLSYKYDLSEKQIKNIIKKCKSIIFSNSN